MVQLDEPATATFISVESSIAELNKLPERIRSCPLSISFKLIDGCFGEYSALNGADSDNTNKVIKVNPPNPFYKTINEETNGDVICFKTNL